MFCPTCGTPNRDDSILCSRCANTLQSAPPPPLPPGASPAAAAPAPAYLQPDLRFSSAPPKAMHWLGIAGIGVVVGLIVFLAATTPIPQLPNRDQEIGYRFGYFIWPFLIAMIAAWLAAGRKKRRDPNLFAILFCSIAIGITALSVVGNLRATGSLPFHRPETAEQKMGRLMREAAGLQPVRKHLFGESRFDTWTRDFFRDVIAFNKQYQQEFDQLDAKDIHALGTSASFADPDLATAGLQEVHARCKLDSLEEQRLQQLLDNFRQRSSDFSSSERQELIKGMDEGLARFMPVRHKVIAAEKAWVDSLDDIYSFARVQHSKISLTGADHLIITDNQVREEFNSRVRAMNSRHQELLKARREFVSMQNNTFQKIGISRKEVGGH